MEFPQRHYGSLGSLEISYIYGETMTAFRLFQPLLLFFEIGWA